MVGTLTNVKKQHQENIFSLKSELPSFESSLKQRESSIQLPVQVLVSAVLMKNISNCGGSHSNGFRRLDLKFIFVSVVGPKCWTHDSETPPEVRSIFGKLKINFFSHFLAEVNVLDHIHVGSDWHSAYFFLYWKTCTAILWSIIFSTSILGSFKASMSRFANIYWW